MSKPKIPEVKYYEVRGAEHFSVKRMALAFAALVALMAILGAIGYLVPEGLKGYYPAVALATCFIALWSMKFHSDDLSFGNNFQFSDAEISFTLSLPKGRALRRSIVNGGFTLIERTDKYVVVKQVSKGKSRTLRIPRYLFYWQESFEVDLIGGKAQVVRIKSPAKEVPRP